MLKIGKSKKPDEEKKPDQKPDQKSNGKSEKKPSGKPGDQKKPDPPKKPEAPKKPTPPRLPGGVESAGLPPGPIPGQDLPDAPVDPGLDPGADPGLPPELGEMVPEMGSETEPTGMEATSSVGYKIDPMIAVYRPPDQGPFACGNCSYFIGPNECDVVDGSIDPNGVCNLFHPPKSGMTPVPSPAMNEVEPTEPEMPPTEPEIPEEEMI